jgi:hypothetical protein
MKYAVLTGLAALLLTLVTEIPSANAVVCARGVARAGCAGPHGAVVARRPVVAPHGAVVARPVVAPHCVIRAGMRVCR